MDDNAGHTEQEGKRKKGREDNLEADDRKWQTYREDENENHENDYDCDDKACDNRKIEWIGKNAKAFRQTQAERRRTKRWKPAPVRTMSTVSGVQMYIRKRRWRKQECKNEMLLKRNG